MSEPEAFLPTLHRWMGAFMRRSMHSFIPYLKSRGISMSQFSAMIRLDHCTQCGVSEMAEHLGITSAAVSQLLEKLVQQGYIVRSEGLHDRRLKAIALTDSGRELLRDTIREREKWVAELENRLTPAEREQITAALNILIEKTNSLEELA